MAGTLKDRPFDNFKAAITDPSYFFGRIELIETVRQSPFRVRILLGGRRIGKTSTLRALEWNLLQEPSSGKPRRAFPVFISLQYRQPKDLDNLRYIMIAELRDAIERWRKVPGAALREKYRSYLRQIGSGELTVSFLTAINAKINLKNPESERRLIHDDFRQALLKTNDELQKWNFEGVCFLLDEAEFIVRQTAWADDAGGYFRGLKDNDTALSPFFGLLLSGYRDLKKYQQKVGSPLLNIAKVEWLNVLTDADTRQLIDHRSCEEEVSLNKVTSKIIEWAGNHPYLTQQILNVLCDNHQTKKIDKWDSLLYYLIRQHDPDFDHWWNQDQQFDGFSQPERSVYHALVQHKQGSAESLAPLTSLSEGEVADALEVLAGTGVIRQLNEEDYVLGAGLFEQWVIRQKN
jgi:hypothetical protein